MNKASEWNFVIIMKWMWKQAHGSSEHAAHVWSKTGLFRFFKSRMWRLGRCNEIPEVPDFFHTCTLCSELPSHISTLEPVRVADPSSDGFGYVSAPPKNIFIYKKKPIQSNKYSFNFAQ